MQSSDENMNPKVSNTNESSTKLDNDNRKGLPDVNCGINKDTTHDTNTNKTIILRRISINNPCLNDDMKNIVMNNSLFDEFSNILE